MAQHFFFRCARRSIAVAAPLRRRQSSAIDFAVGRERQSRQNHYRRRQHVPGQQFCQAMLQSCQIKWPSIGKNDIRNELFSGSTVLMSNDACLFNFGLYRKRVFNFTKLNAEAANLYLLIGTAKKFKTPMRLPADEIASAVHARAARERVGDEALRRESGSIEISPSQTSAG